IAAEALACLAGKAQSLQKEMIGMLQRLAGDQSKRVRGRLGEKIWALHNKKPELIWEILERWVEELPSRPEDHDVLRHTMKVGFEWLYKINPPRKKNLPQNLLEALRPIKDAKFLSLCGNWLACLHYGKGNSWADQTLRNRFDN